MSHRVIPFLLTLSLLIIAGCKDGDPVIPAESDTYIFLGHTYEWHAPQANRIDQRLEKIDYRQFRGVLLGGDICVGTTRFEANLDYLDDIFNLSNPRTMWSVGNHDVREGNYQWIEESTGRPFFYSVLEDNIVWLILNTSIEDMTGLVDVCAMKDAQVEFIFETLDTITPTHPLVILTHHAVWGDVAEDMITDITANALRGWYNFSCSSVVRFHTEIYPVLHQLALNGQEIVVISGDCGQYSKGYQYTMPDGIRFYLSGINNSVDTSLYNPPRPFNLNPDSILLMHHDTLNNSLDLEFVPLSDIH